MLVRLIPAPRGTSIVAAAVPKKLLQMAGVSDCYTCARGQTATLGNFGKQMEKRETLERKMFVIASGVSSRVVLHEGSTSTPVGQ